MAMPLVTSFAVGGFSVPGILLATAVLSGFVAHEPLLVLLGRRGGRAQRELRGRATRWLLVTAGIAAVTGLLALLSMPPQARWSLALPLTPAAVLGAAIAAGREKSSAAEVAVALAFSFVAVPVCLAAGAALQAGMAIAVVFAAVFGTSTLAVRRVIVGVRGGGNPQAARALRTLVLVMVAAAGVTLVVAASRARLPWPAVPAAIPGLAVACWIALFPPPPARLRTVGWLLVTSSAAAVLILITGLAGSR